MRLKEVIGLKEVMRFKNVIPLEADIGEQEFLRNRQQKNHRHKNLE